MRRPLVSALALCALLTACFGSSTPPDDGAKTSSSLSSETVMETRNVTYRGTVEELGVTVYQQGTHRLALGDGRMILLESATVNLESYLNHEVEAFGAIRPSVEAGGIIMRVERITDLSPALTSSAAESSVIAVQSSAPVSSAAPLSSAAPSSKSAVVSSTAPRSSASAQASSQTTGGSVDAGLNARVLIMASHDLAPGHWTQRYCTEHIGFCIPVHKNWWFRSFGTTSSTLWHVEMNTEDFESIGTGPISVDLIGGDLPTSDGSIVVQGTTAIGYRAWTQGRHFEIRGDARLEATVRYMTEHLEATSNE